MSVLDSESEGPIFEVWREKVDFCTDCIVNTPPPPLPSPTYSSCTLRLQMNSVAVFVVIHQLEHGIFFFKKRDMEQQESVALTFLALAIRSFSS